VQGSLSPHPRGRLIEQGEAEDEEDVKQDVFLIEKRDISTERDALRDLLPG